MTEIRKNYKDKHNRVWGGPFFCGEHRFFACAGPFLSSELDDTKECEEVDPTWTEIDEREAKWLTGAIVLINRYLTLCQVTRDTPMEERAKQIAVQAHLNQTRWNGDAYITHPIRVAEYACVGLSELSPETVRSVAYLHDTDLTLNDLRRFCFPEDVVDGVDAVTRRQNESYTQFIIRAKHNLIGRVVKIADLKDNLSDLTDKNKTMRDKYELALWILENT